MKSSIKIKKYKIIRLLVTKRCDNKLEETHCDFPGEICKFKASLIPQKLEYYFYFLKNLIIYFLNFLK